jgi:hypothetical protein
LDGEEPIMIIFCVGKSRLFERDKLLIVIIIIHIFFLSYASQLNQLKLKNVSVFHYHLKMFRKMSISSWKVFSHLSTVGERRSWHGITIFYITLIYRVKNHKNVRRQRTNNTENVKQFWMKTIHGQCPRQDSR